MMTWIPAITCRGMEVWGVVISLSPRGIILVAHSVNGGQSNAWACVPNTVKSSALRTEWETVENSMKTSLDYFGLKNIGSFDKPLLPLFPQFEVRPHGTPENVVLLSWFDVLGQIAL